MSAKKDTQEKTPDTVEQGRCTSVHRYYFIFSSLLFQPGVPQLVEDCPPVTSEECRWYEFCRV